MLRRRKPAEAGAFVYEDDPKKELARTAGARLKHVQVLLRTVVAAVWCAINPSPEIRSLEYSRFLTNRTRSLTIGWHIFRTITEGTFLMTYGLAWNTVVVQVFWCMSASSVLAHFLHRPVWMAWRETICVWTNITYGIITVLKIFHLVPRLPNENNYMFKHCFLTMADATFSQTPVHKQYVVQFAEAIIRIIVWRRYHVLPGVPAWGVIVISIAWQIWLVTFASMLQARQVSAFFRQRATDAAATATATGPGSSSSSAAAAGSATTSDAAPASTSPPVPALATDADTKAAGSGPGMAGTAAAPAPATSPSPATTTTATSVTTTTAVAPSGAAAIAAVAPAPSVRAAPAGDTQPVSSPSTHRTHGHAHAHVRHRTFGGASPRNSLTLNAYGSSGQHQGQQPARAAAGVGGTGSPMASLRDSVLAGSSQMRYMKALRAVARGPSSYVLLVHQRLQAGGPQCASAQFYISSASPEMLVANWREKLAAAVAEGAPGWQVANACIRKGSLIVHLDLVYTGGADAASVAATATAACAAAAASSALFDTGKSDTGSASASASGVGGGLASTAFSFMPPTSAYSAAPIDSFDPNRGREVLDDYMGGMSAESLMALLGLPPDLPTGPCQPVTVQMGAEVRELSLNNSADDNTGSSPGPEAATAATTTAAAVVAAAAGEVMAATEIAAAGKAAAADEDAAAAAGTSNAAACHDATAAVAASSITAITAAATALVAAGSDTRPAAPAATFGALLQRAVILALRYPPGLRSPEYNDFLTRQVGRLHLSYAAFICLTAALAVVMRSGIGITAVALLMTIAAEVLSCGTYLLCGSAVWRRYRRLLVYTGVLLWTLQMAVCTCGILPYVFTDRDCVTGRWVQKVVMLKSLQALCMQPPVRTFFLVRLPSLAMVIHVHIYVCRFQMSLAHAIALHVGWECLLFVVSAYLQQRHYEAFLKTRTRQLACASADKLAAAESTVGACAEGVMLDKPAAGSAADAVTALNERKAASSEDGGAAKVALPALVTADAVTAGGEPTPAAPPEEVQAAVPIVNPEAEAALAAASADPTSVLLSSPVVAMVSRRPAHLELHFVCAPAIIDELQVVLRHINPASMSSGVHSAHTVRDITHALAAPYSAAAAPPHVPAPFTVELTLVASPADMPGIVHVELWRGRRRISTQPVLLAAKPPPAAAVANAPPSDSTTGAASTSLLRACAARISEAGGAAGHVTWLDDVASYVEGLRAQGHSSAADQFVEELGGWLAGLAAMERGLMASSTAAGGAAPRIANVLYFHGYGSEFMYIKPRKLSNAGGASGAATAGGATSAASTPQEAALQGTLRQLLLCQGSMLLAVSAEAGCVALSDYLTCAMVSRLGATLPSLLEEARTPVTQLPLLHAAVKSGSEQMVDLVAEWFMSSGSKDIWAAEAAVLAVSLESALDGLQADSASFAHIATGNSTRGRRRSQLSITASEKGDSLPFRYRGHASVGACISASVAPSASLGSQAGNAAPPGSRTLSNRSMHLAAARPSGPAPGQIVAALAADEPVAAPGLYDDGGLYDEFEDLPIQRSLSEETPFKVIDFRSSYRGGAAAAAAVAAAAGCEPSAGRCGRASQDCCSWNGCGDGGAGGAGGEDARAAASGLAAARASAVSSLDRRRSVDGSLVDGGVVVLTPLHLALALGDEGRLASHILRTYPEAYELWRQVSGGPHPETDFAQSGAHTVGTPGLSPSPSSVVPVPACSTSIVPAAATAAATAAPRASQDSASLNPIAMPAFNSMPGLARRTPGRGGLLGAIAGGGGGGGLDMYASMEVDFMQSMSLSEVAFLEGMRWVHHDETPRRGGFKVTRM